MQIDTHVSLGNIITVGVMIFGIGGAWISVKMGLAATNDQLAKEHLENRDRLEKIASELERIRTNYLSKELHDAQERRIEDKVLDLVRRVEHFERQQPPR